MIVENGKYYLYRHIRLDKNEPFYIGIGTKNNAKFDIKMLKIKPKILSVIILFIFQYSVFHTLLAHSCVGDSILS